MKIPYKRNSFKEIVERIKDIISQDYDRFVLDKDVANELNLAAKTISIYKAADKIPLNNLAYFCFKRDISFDWLVFGKGITPKKINIEV